MSVVARLQIPPDAPVRPGARVTVRLLDVGRADAPATVLDEHVVVLDRACEHRLDLDLRLPPTGEGMPAGTWSVSAHVDLDGSGELSAGDLLTTTHVGVDQTCEGQVVEVPLTRLG